MFNQYFIDSIANAVIDKANNVQYHNYDLARIGLILIRNNQQEIRQLASMVQKAVDDIEKGRQDIETDVVCTTVIGDRKVWSSK